MKYFIQNLILLLITSLTGWGQTIAPGTVRGSIVDSQTGETLVGVNILVVGTTRGTSSDIDGNFKLSLPAGTYSLRFSSVSYQAKVLTGVEVKPGAVTPVAVSLVEEILQSEEVVIEAEMEKSTESAILTQQRKSFTVSDAVSAESIKRSADKNAGDTIRRVTGISLLGGRYVYVRGLGERYSNTQLNGVGIPSPEPEKRVVPFDLFPANMILNMTTVKTFTPDQSGDFAGGSVHINTKEFPEGFQFNVSTSSSVNTDVQFRNLPTYLGGKYDFLGFDDGTRGFPGNVSKDPPTSPPTHTQMARDAAGFQDQWTPVRKEIPLNQSFNLSLGDEIRKWNIPVGYLFSVSYSSDFSHKFDHQFYPKVNPLESPQYDHLMDQTIYSILWGTMLNVTAKPSQTDKIGFKALYNRSAEDEARVLTGFNGQGSTEGNYRSTQLRFVSRSLLSLLLSGEHQIPLVTDSRLEWRAAVSRADRDEPDNRETTYKQETDGSFTFPNNFGSANGRFFSNLVDNEKDFGLDWIVPLKPVNGLNSKLKVGTLGRLRDREFQAYRFIYDNANYANNAYLLPPEELFQPSSIAAGNIDFKNNTQRNDTYRANEQLLGSYAMVDMIYRNTRFVGGVRYEYSSTGLKSFEPNGSQINQEMNTDLITRDVLPSLNLIYTIHESANLRFAYSQTLARPEFRELAPFRYDDYRTSTYGNAALKRTLIRNYDVRWEWFSRLGEVTAISAFYKKLIDPIENIYIPSANNRNLIPVNASDARNYGLEFELRRGLDVLSSRLSNFSIAVNWTLLRSEIIFDPNEAFQIRSIPNLTELKASVLANQTRPLEGQSPYVINLNLNYVNPRWGTTLALYYNRLGRRIREVGTYGYDDTYEQPRNQVDLTGTQSLGNRYQLKISVKNVLDEPFIFKMKDYEVSKFYTGRSFSISLSYSI